MTLTDLSTLALQTYGIVAIGRAPSSKDATFAQGALTRALAQLAAPPHDIAVWTIEATPDAYADAFIEFAAPAFVPYGAMGTGEAQALKSAGLAKLRELTRGTRATAPGTADYF